MNLQNSLWTSEGHHRPFSKALNNRYLCERIQSGKQFESRVLYVFVTTASSGIVFNPVSYHFISSSQQSPGLPLSTHVSTHKDNLAGL